MWLPYRQMQISRFLQDDKMCVKFLCTPTGQIFHDEIIVTIAEAAELHKFLY